MLCDECTTKGRDKKRTDWDLGSGVLWEMVFYMIILASCFFDLHFGVAVRWSGMGSEGTNPI